jgi:hypothetical protein
LMDTWVVPISWLVWIVLQWTWMCRCLLIIWIHSLWIYTQQ